MTPLLSKRSRGTDIAGVVLPTCVATSSRLTSTPPSDAIALREFPPALLRTRDARMAIDRPVVRSFGFFRDAASCQYFRHQNGSVQGPNSGNQLNSAMKSPRDWVEWSCPVRSLQIAS